MARPFPEYETFDALGLAALVADGEITPAELVEAGLDRIDRRNPKLNAVVKVEADRARAAADEPPGDGPFAGVPFVVKDLELVAGERTTFGSVFFRDYVAETSSELARRMRHAGLISLGRTNTPEFGLLPVTEPVLFGATANPWDLARSPGGSSGGAAAAVAAGIVPMAHGGDGGGSIRIPAANCGIFGLKASRGRIPQHPAAPSDMLALGGCLSRTVRDSAAFLDATAGALPGARYALPPPDTPFTSAPSADPGRLRIAVMRTDFAGEALNPDCAAAVETTAHLLEDLGHDVEDARPAIPPDDVEAAFLVVWAALAASIFELILEEAAKTRRGRFMRRAFGDRRTVKIITRLDERKSGLEAFEPFTVGLAERSSRQTPAKLAMADTVLQTASYRLAEFMGGYDILLTPTLGAPPVLTGEIDQTEAWDDLERRLRAYVPFTPIANFTGRPAMSVPLHWSDDGLPIGSHFIGAEGGEFALLRLAGQLERARPWAQRTPDVASI